MVVLLEGSEDSVLVSMRASCVNSVGGRVGVDVDMLSLMTWMECLVYGGDVLPNSLCS